MKSAIRLLILLFTVLILTNTANAESPREQLKQMVEQLQTHPNDNTLREQIIKLAQELKPAPAVPEEAERRMARGTAAFKGAKSVADYRESAKEFEQATLAAPWYGDAYLNLGVAQDKAENYEAALRSLKLALLTSPNDKEIKALIYEVDYRNEKTNSPEAQAARQAEIQREKDAIFKKSLDGAVFIRRRTLDYGTAEWEIYINNGEATYSYDVIAWATSDPPCEKIGMRRPCGTWRQILMNSGYSGAKSVMASGRLEGRQLTLVNRVARNEGTVSYVAAGASMECEISHDGFTNTCIGTLIDNETWVFQRK